ncbi:hypothetical protein [Streptomyces flaveolus]|uniref:hypothetical protein n=1 Tax=Streptomyces flaveolus TaxID=67297 RepID=UPI0033F404E1
MSEAEHQARRSMAYQLAAREDLPNAVRVAAAAAQEAIDAGRDATVPGPRWPCSRSPPRTAAPRARSTASPSAWRR